MRHKRQLRFDAPAFNFRSGGDIISGFGQGVTTNLMSFSEDLRFHWTFGTGGTGAPTTAPNLTRLTSVLLPDASGGDVGKGFTCTGLAKDPDLNWWIGNDGRNQDGDSSYLTSIVKISADGTTKLAEWPIPQLGVQGVAYDTSNDTLWYCGNADQFIFHLNKNTGASLGSIPFVGAQPNGLAYDSFRDKLWCLFGQSISRVNKATGAIEFSYDLQGIGGDHISYDSARDYLWISAGANATPGLLLAYDIKKDRIVWQGTLTSTEAVEGVYIAGSLITVVTDGWFHATPPGSVPAPYNINAIETYTLPALTGCVFQRAFGQYAMGPFGRMADRIILNKGAGTAGTDFANVNRNGDLTIAQQKTLSFYVKPTWDDESPTTGIRVASAAQQQRALVGGAGWQRISVTGAADAQPNCQLVLRGTFGTADYADLLVTACQLESGTILTPYNPRLGA
jgi:hypothetical protein